LKNLSQKKRSGGVAEGVDLSSNPSTAKKGGVGRREGKVI
jgi:hypothetical protein